MLTRACTAACYHCFLSSEVSIKMTCQAPDMSCQAINAGIIVAKGTRVVKNDCIVAECVKNNKYLHVHLNAPLGCCKPPVTSHEWMVDVSVQSLSPKVKRHSSSQFGPGAALFFTGLRGSEVSRLDGDGEVWLVGRVFGFSRSVCVLSVGACVGP